MGAFALREGKNKKLPFGTAVFSMLIVALESGIIHKGSIVISNVSYTTGCCKAIGTIEHYYFACGIFILHMYYLRKT